MKNLCKELDATRRDATQLDKTDSSFWFSFHCVAFAWGLLCIFAPLKFFVVRKKYKTKSEEAVATIKRIEPLLAAVCSVFDCVSKSLCRWFPCVFVIPSWKLTKAAQTGGTGPKEKQQQTLSVDRTKVSFSFCCNKLPCPPVLLWVWVFLCVCVWRCCFMTLYSVSVSVRACVCLCFWACEGHAVTCS